MRNERFDVSVTVETGNIGRLQVVTDTAQAAVLLTQNWPSTVRGPKYQKALEVISNSMICRKKAGAARKAFVEAAIEANVFVREGHHVG
jgi:hypothetical protein